MKSLLMKNSNLTQFWQQDRENKDIKYSSQQNLLFSEVSVEMSSIFFYDKYTYCLMLRLSIVTMNIVHHV